jgi:hypothetical protein
MMVGAVVAKSSAVSVSSLPGLAVRESVAIFPSGSPVLKKNVSALAYARYCQVTQEESGKEDPVFHGDLPD